jgi:hypothetical protein
MVNFNRFIIATQIAPLNGILPTSASNSLLNALNTSWGFSPDSSVGFRLEGGNIKLGTMKLDDFMAMPLSQKFAFINNPSVFDAPTRSKISAAIDANFVDPTTRTRALDMGQSTINKLKNDVDINAKDGTINTGSSKWISLMTSLGKLAIFSGGVILSLKLINQLLEGNSGCFLEGPNGESIRLGGSDTFCGCDPLDNADAPNPLRGICCEKCKVGGDSALICPGDTPSATWTIPYACPTDAAPSGARVHKKNGKSRSTISAYASAAQQRAESMALTKSNAMEVLSAADTACVSCGCGKTVGEWRLCKRKATVWSVIGGLVADSGKLIKETANGMFDLVDMGLDVLLSPLKTIVLVIGVAIGVAIVVGASIMIARVVKKKRKVLTQLPLNA